MACRVTCFTCIFLCSLSSMSMGDTKPQPTNDATLRIREITIPASDFWSPEFRSLYAKRVGVVQESRPDPHPARNAPKAEWDKYDAWVNSFLEEPLAEALKRYPVDLQDTHIAGIHVGIITPKSNVMPENKDRVLINLHGGGFVEYRGLRFGQLESIPVASMGGLKVITVDYRQAPYFQYPAASEDVETVYRELLTHYKAESIGLFGCSAGGRLASQAIARFQAKGLPRPGAVGIFCMAPSRAPQGPQGDSRIWGLSGVISESGETAQPSPAIRWYMEAADPKDPTAYPGSFDSVLARFPPTLLLVGTRESHFSPTIVAHTKLLKLGVDSSLYVMEGAWHAAHVYSVGTSEAHDANAYIARWFLQRLAR